MAEMTVRNPYLVLIWSFGLFLFMHLSQYVGALLAAWRSGQTFETMMSGKYEDSITSLMRGIGTVVIGIPLAWVAVRFLWRRPMEWMQLSFSGGWFLAGLAIGLVLPVVLSWILSGLGQASIERSRCILASKRKTAWLLGMACLALFTGIAEEIVFRAMAARELSLVWGWPVAVLVAGAYFGIVHLIGQLKTMTWAKGLSIMLSSILVSFLLIAMYVRSGSLWLPIGFHAAWNFSLVGIIGLPMNGEQAEVSLFRTRLVGSGWWTGGAVGLEASGLAMLAYLVIGALFVIF